MEKLDKKTRHKIYKIAKKIISEDFEEFMCEALRDSHYILFPDSSGITYDALTDLLPEFKKKKPKNLRPSEYWFEFDDEGHKKRISVLSKCIAETKTKKS